MEANVGIEMPQTSSTLTRDEIKAMRKIRNKEKRLRKKEMRVTENEHPPNVISKSGNVSIVSEIINKVAENSYNAGIVKRSQRNITLDLLQQIDRSLERGCDNLKSSHKHKKLLIANNVPNKLDASQPMLKRGKQRETPKKKQSKLKNEIVLENNKEAVISPPFEYVDNEISEELELQAISFIRRISEIQEKLYQRDPIKGKLKRRFILGFHEVRKFLSVDKVKLLLFATNINVKDQNDALHKTIKELIGLCNEHGVPYVFALKRRILGKTMLKNVPVSCLGILNYDGANEQFESLVREMEHCKEKFILKCNETSSKNSEIVYQSLFEKIKEELVM